MSTTNVNSTSSSQPEQGGCILPNGSLSIFDGILLVIIQQGALWGNILVFVAFLRYRVLRTVTNIFIASLSAADILVAVLPIPMTFAVFICSKLPATYAQNDVVDIVYNVTDILCSSVSIMSLTLVAVERCIAVVFPFKHGRIVTKKVAVWAIVFIWCCTFAASMMRLVLERPALTLFSILFSFAIPIPIMTFSYVLISIIARNHARKIFALERSTRITSHNAFRDREDSVDSNVDITRKYSNATDIECSNTGNDSNEPAPVKKKSLQVNGAHIQQRIRRGTIRLAHRARNMKRELKAAKTLSLIILSFIITWTPFMIANVAFYICITDETFQSCTGFFISYSFVKYAKFLHYLNSATNPFLYGLLNRKWRAAFKAILCVFRKKRAMQEPMQSELAGW